MELKLRVLIFEHGVVALVVASCKCMKVEGKNRTKLLANGSEVKVVILEVVQFKDNSIATNIRSQLNYIYINVCFFYCSHPYQNILATLLN